MKIDTSIALDVNNGNESQLNLFNTIPTHAEINEGNKDDIDKEAENNIKDEAVCELIKRQRHLYQVEDANDLD